MNDQGGSSGGATAWMREELARYTYKPGWAMEIVPAPWTVVGWTLIVRYTANDSRSEFVDARQVRVVTRSAVAEYVVGVPEAFADWLAFALREIEIHESQEWLRRDGKVVNDPHKPPVRYGERFLSAGALP